MFPIRFARKRHVIKIIFIVALFLILLNEITRRTSSPSYFYGSQRNKAYNQTCDIPVKNNQASLAHRFPHIIIIGFGKTGTRALYQMIRLHPDVIGSSNEVRFFSNDQKYKQGIYGYLRLMPPTTATQRTIEKSPDYIIKPGTAERLKKALDHCHRSDDIKFIVVLREPFKRAVSEYLEWKLYVHHHMGKTLDDFEKLAIKETGEVNNFHSQVNTSIYSYHIKKWLKIFDVNKICFVDGDALVKEPYSVVKKLEKCLELRDFITSKHFHYNKMKGYYCPVNEQGIANCLASSKGRTHPNIDKDVEMKLRKFYELYNKELYNITGISFGW